MESDELDCSSLNPSAGMKSVIETLLLWSNGMIDLLVLGQFATELCFLKKWGSGCEKVASRKKRKVCKKWNRCRSKHRRIIKGKVE